MGKNVEYLLQLHRNGVITDGDLRKGIRNTDRITLSTRSTFNGK